MNHININQGSHPHSQDSSSDEDPIPQDQQIQKRAADAYLRIVPSSCKDPQNLDYGIDVIALCGQAKYDSKLYCGTSSKKRCEVYKKENEEESDKISKETHIRVLKEDAARNSTVMAISVVVFGGIGSLGWFAGPVGGGPGTSLGICAGLVVGGLIIHKHVNKNINIAIKFSDHYATWRSKAITEKAYPIFRNFLDTDTEFEDFMCPIAQDICSIPMLAPDGRTYNQKEIYEYIEHQGARDGQNVRSPIRGEDFCKNDLVVNTKYCRDLANKAEKVYQDVLKYGRDRAIGIGMKAVIKNTKELMEGIRLQVSFQMYNALEPEVRAKRMTNDERAEHINAATKQWDFR